MTYRCTRKYNYSGPITLSASTNLYGGVSPALSGLPSYTDFTGLYDSYKIVQIDAEFVPTIVVNDATCKNIPTLHVVIDFDNAATPGSENTLLQYENCETVCFNKVYKRSWQPCIDLAAYNSGFTGTTSIPSTKNWLDCSSPSINHYGLKYGFVNIGGTVTDFVAVLYLTYHIELKHAV
jgi:hypothetical protein